MHHQDIALLREVRRRTVRDISHSNLRPAWRQYELGYPTTAETTTDHSRWTRRLVFTVGGSSWDSLWLVGMIEYKVDQPLVDDIPVLYEPGSEDSSPPLARISPHSAIIEYQIATSPIAWIKIPQRRYDGGRRQQNSKPLEPVSFSTNRRPGINLGDALHRRISAFDDRTEPVLQGAPGVIWCRLLVGFS